MHIIYGFLLLECRACKIADRLRGEVALSKLAVLNVRFPVERRTHPCSCSSSSPYTDKDNRTAKRRCEGVLSKQNPTNSRLLYILLVFQSPPSSVLSDDHAQKTSQRKTLVVLLRCRRKFLRWCVVLRSYVSVYAKL